MRSWFHDFAFQIPTCTHTHILVHTHTHTVPHTHVYRYAKAKKLEGDIASIAAKLDVAEVGLQDPRAELDKVLENVKVFIGKKQLDEVKNMRNPSPSIKAVLAAVHLVLNAKVGACTSVLFYCCASCIQFTPMSLKPPALFNPWNL